MWYLIFESKSKIKVLNRFMAGFKTINSLLKQKHSPKFKRWGKNEDILMFSLLRSILASKDIDEESFLNVALETILDDFNEKIVDTEYLKIAEEIANETNW